MYNSYKLTIQISYRNLRTLHFSFWCPVLCHPSHPHHRRVGTDVAAEAADATRDVDSSDLEMLAARVARDVDGQIYSDRKQDQKHPKTPNLVV